ncbi:MAG: DNA repair protein RadC [Rikenellaceae bacterium]|nr:DNA repair protein RadC [Rikenellaceae bacterium]
MTMRGIKSLDDAELLALVLESKTQATTLLEEYGSLSNIANTPTNRLRMTAGLGVKLSERIQAAVEIGRRISTINGAVEEVITSSEDVVKMMRPLLQELKHEECWAIYLTNSNRVVERCRISQGGVQATVVDQRLIVKRALELLSTRLIIVHNHPSGSATPSGADFDITKRIKEATSLFDIQLLDHIIITATEDYSFKSNGRL